MAEFITTSITAAVITLAAAVFDKKTGKIPNKLTFSAIIIGIVMTMFFRPPLWWLTFAIIAALFFFGMTGVIGLGDLKLFMAVTAIGGWKMFLTVFASSMLLMCLCAFVFDRQRFYMYAFKTLRRFKGNRLKIDETVKYYFAPFIFAGVIIYILFFDKYSPFYEEMIRFVFGITR